MVVYSEGILLIHEVSATSIFGRMNRLIGCGYLQIDILLERSHLELTSRTDLQIPIPMWTHETIREFHWHDFGSWEKATIFISFSNIQKSEEDQ